MTEPLDDGSLGSLISRIHHVRIPVSDPWVSRDWYSSALSFQPVLDLEDSDGVVGVLLRHSSGILLALHHDTEAAAVLRGFPILGLEVADVLTLRNCAARLERNGLAHSPLRQGHLGWYVDVPDPDGIVIRLHSETVIAAEDA